MSYETVTIYKNKKSGLYIVQPMTKHPMGASAEFGDPTPVTEEAFESLIVPVVEENLRKYHQQQYDQNLAPKSSEAEHMKFVQEHYCVDVTVDDNGIVEVTPLGSVRGGYVGLKEGKASFNKEEIEVRLPTAIRAAFQVAM